MAAGEISALRLINTLSGTQPLLLHAQGHHRNKPHWQPIKAAFFATPERRIGPIPELAVVTCNNGHRAMGILERSLDHLGIPYRVLGRGVRPWVNAVSKPRCLLEAARSTDAPYLLYADSRDAIAIGDLSRVLAHFRSLRGCELLFGADRINWPPLREFARFEEGLPGAKESDFRYLNGGLWIGRTSFCRKFFAEVVATAPVPGAEQSEQGLLKTLFPRHYPRVQLDYTCALFQNLGFVGAPIFEIHDD